MPLNLKLSENDDPLIYAGPPARKGRAGETVRAFFQGVAIGTLLVVALLVAYWAGKYF